MTKTKVVGLCLLAFITITLLVFWLTPHTAAQADSETIKTSSATIVAPPEEKIVQKALAIPQIMLDISFAESHSNQNKVGYNYRYRTVTNADGTTTKEKYLWSKDIGLYQINDYYNQASCKKAGHDIYTVEGNTACAMLLYSKSGTQPWNASKYCWSDIVACKAKRGGNYK